MAALTWHGPAALRRRVVAIDSLKPWPGNPRTHDLPTIQASLRAFGQYRPIVAQSSTRRIIAGHGTCEGARAEGWTGIACDLIDVGDEAAKMLAVDNRANDLAGYDSGLLAAFLRSLPDLDATGFSAGDLAELMAGLAAQAGAGDPDSVPEPPAPTCQPGELWALGPHRLLCGDSTEPGALTRLLGEERVDVLWTDPPYGVGYEGGPYTPRRRLANDALAPAALELMLAAAFTQAVQKLGKGASYYITGPAGAQLMFTFLQAMRQAGLELHHMLIWVKQSPVMGRADYHYQHEPVLAGSLPDAELEADPVAYGWQGRHDFHGGRRQSSVWQIPRPTRSPLHPTQKPVELVERAIRNSAPMPGVVLDLFAGSGTTLIAAARAERVARLVELDPINCDVILRRWQEFSGGVLPVRVATGEEVSFEATTTARSNGHAGAAGAKHGRRPRARNARQPAARTAPARSRR